MFAFCWCCRYSKGQCFQSIKPYQFNGRGERAPLFPLLEQCSRDGFSQRRSRECLWPFPEETLQTPRRWDPLYGRARSFRQRRVSLLPWGHPVGARRVRPPSARARIRLLSCGCQGCAHPSFGSSAVRLRVRVRKSIRK